MAKLLPCPFCGGEMSMVYNSHDNAFEVYHKSGYDGAFCPVIEPILIGDLEVMSLASAAEVWNRRAYNATD